MSLETQIAALVTAANNLTSSVNGKMGQIDDKVDAAVASVPAEIVARMARVQYVDYVGGDDANTGNSLGQAKRTIKAAIDSSPRGALLTVYLKSGVIHQMGSEVDCTNKVVLLQGLDYVHNDRNTYAQVISTPYLTGDDTLVGGGFTVGTRGFIGVIGVKFSTVQFAAQHAGKAQPIWQTSLFKTNSSQGWVRLQHCQVDILNGAMMYQHSTGSIGIADLLMRNVLIKKVDISGLPVPTGNQQMMASVGNQQVPFSMFGIDLVREGAATWGALITQDLTNARTNISLT